MGNEELILKKLDAMEEKLKKLDVIESRVDSVYSELQDFKKETEVNFWAAQQERNTLSSMIEKRDKDIVGINDILHNIRTRIGIDYNVPKLSVRLEAVDYEVKKHTEQISKINTKLSLA